MKSYIEFYKKGFLLVQRNLNVFLISYFLTAGSTIVKSLEGTEQSFSLLTLIGFIFILASLAFTFIPVLIYDKALDKKRSSIKDIIVLTVKNFGRTIRPLLLAALLFFAIVGGIYFFLRSENSLTMIYLLTFIITILTPLMFYFSILYMIERKSVIASVIHSVKFSLSHKAFSFLPLPFLILNFFMVAGHIFGSKDTVLLNLIYLFVLNYVNLVILSASLIYYRESINKDNVILS